MKKDLFVLLLALTLPLSFASAMTDEGIWSYFFNLEYKQGVLAVDSSARFPYDPVPEEYSALSDPATSDFYGIITSGKGRELARFGFNKPETTVTALGKSVFVAKAPFFANADHASFYARGGKKLFTVSLKESSFCDDNNKCNSDVGENYLNCPNDCLPPPSETVNPRSEERRVGKECRL